MKILKSFTRWLNKTTTENKKNKTNSFDYTPSKDIYQEIRDIRNEAKKKYMQNSDQIKSMSTYNNTNVYGGGGFGAITSALPGQYSNITIANNTPTGLKVEGTLEVKGRDILKELDEMRDALLLLKRDVDMEEKYPRLKEIKDEYEKALEKYKTFDRIKESN